MTFAWLILVTSHALEVRLNLERLRRYVKPRGLGPDSHRLPWWAMNGSVRSLVVVLVAMTVSACGTASQSAHGSHVQPSATIDASQAASAPASTEPSEPPSAAPTTAPIEAFRAIPRTEGTLNTLVVGTDTIAVGGFSGPSFAASIQVFSDGAWSPAIVPESRGQVTGIVAFGEGLLAVGNTLPDTRTGFVWQSADGRDWRLVHTIDDAALHDIIVADDIVVAVGARLDSEMNATASAWTSTDGASWSLAKVSGASSAAMGAITTTDGGLAAIGDRRLGQPRPVWTATAATSWSSRANDLNDQLLPIDVVESPAGLAIVGASGRSGDQHPFVALSADAERWKQTNFSREEGYASAITLVDDRLVVAGIDADRLTLWWQQGAEWQAEPHDPMGATINSLVWHAEWGLIGVGSKDAAHAVWVFDAPQR